MITNALAGRLVRLVDISSKTRPKTMCNTCVRKKPRKPRIEVGRNKEFGIYRSNAELRGLPFHLTREEFEDLITKTCYYCGVGPEKRGSYRVPMNGIDRVDNNLGYTLANTVTCCTQCNMMKKDLTQEVFISKIAAIHNNLQLGEIQCH